MRFIEIYIGLLKFLADLRDLLNQVVCILKCRIFRDKELCIKVALVTALMDLVIKNLQEAQRHFENYLTALESFQKEQV